MIVKLVFLVIRPDSETDREGSLIRTTIFYPILDKALKELNDFTIFDYLRFSQQSVELLTGIDSFSPKSKQFLNSENLRPFAMQYKSNVADLEIEFKQLTRLMNRKKTSNEFTAKTLLDMLEFVRRYEDAFFETKRLLFIACSIPTVADTEGARGPWPPYKPMYGRLTSCSRRKDKRIMVGQFAHRTERSQCVR